MFCIKRKFQIKKRENNGSELTYKKIRQKHSKII
jgi:hypothetical protein